LSIIIWEYLLNLYFLLDRQQQILLQVPEERESGDRTRGQQHGPLPNAQRDLVLERKSHLGMGTFGYDHGTRFKFFPFKLGHFSQLYI